MAISSEFKEAVQLKNVIRIRIMLKDSLLLDPTASQFDEMMQFAIDNMGNIYTEHDGERLNYEVNAWNEEYLNQQMVAVVNNFSRERIDLLKGMVRYLFKEKANRIRNERSDSHTRSGITHKQIGGGLTVAGAGIAIAGICTAHTAITIGGAAIAVVGISMIVTDKGDV